VGGLQEEGPGSRCILDLPFRAADLGLLPSPWSLSRKSIVDPELSWKVIFEPPRARPLSTLGGRENQHPDRGELGVLLTTLSRWGRSVLPGSASFGSGRASTGTPWDGKARRRKAGGIRGCCCLSSARAGGFSVSESPPGSPESRTP